MKTYSYFSCLIIVAFGSLLGTSAADEVERVYELESLKYVYTVSLTISGDQVLGSLQCQEYEDGRGEQISFTGTVKGSQLTIKLKSDPEYLAVADPDDEGFHKWKATRKKLLIPIHSADDDGNPMVVDMPLRLKK